MAGSYFFIQWVFVTLFVILKVCYQYGDVKNALTTGRCLRKDVLSFDH